MLQAIAGTRFQQRRAFRSLLIWGKRCFAIDNEELEVVHAMESAFSWVVVPYSDLLNGHTEPAHCVLPEISSDVTSAVDVLLCVEVEDVVVSLG